MCYSENIIVPCEVNGRMVHALVYFMQGLEGSAYLTVDERSANAKSIIGVLSLGLSKGSEVMITISSDDRDKGEGELLKAVRYVRGLGEG